MKMTLLISICIVFMFSGCFVGKIVSLPFKAVGTVVPGVGAVGDAVDVATPF